MARNFDEGGDWDAADAKKWSKDDLAYNVKYLVDRGADVEGSPTNQTLRTVMVNRVGESKADKAMADALEGHFEDEGPQTDEEDLDTGDLAPSDEFVPGAKKGGKK